MTTVRRLRPVFLIVVLGLLFTAAPGGAQAAADPTIGAVGDMGCSKWDADYNDGDGTATRCRQRYVSDLLVNPLPTAVLVLGDNQYEEGQLDEFQTVYDPTFGRANGVVYPVLGNAEYDTPNAQGYFDYFSSVGVNTRVAGTAVDASNWANGYYSFDVGTWHLIALNSNCEIVACAAGSAQEQWLKADLAAHRNMCTLAYWHHPHFTSGNGAGDEDTTAFWNDLYAAGADLVLVGHSHDYERFAPLTPAGKPDAANGIREFVVGTGGDDHTSFPHPILPGTEVRDDTTFGFLALTLRPTGYDWRFMPVGGAFSDAGAGSCH